MTAGRLPLSAIHAASIRPVWRPIGPPWIAKLTNPSAHAHRFRNREPTLLRPSRNGPVRLCSSRAMSHHSAAGGWIVVIAACADTSTRCAVGDWSATSAPSAPYMPLQYGDCGCVVLTGGRPSSPASHRLPLAAVTSRSEAGRPESGPSWPKGVIETTIVSRTSSSSPSPRSLPGGKDSTTMRAVATSRVNRARPSDDARSQVTPRLFTFAASHGMERSLFSTSPTNGGCTRSASPPGGSTFTTSAPRSARMRPHTAPLRSARSRTRQPPRSEGSCVAFRLAAVPGERLDPAVHDGLRARDLGLVEPLLRIDAVDGIDRPHEVVLVAVRHRRVDRHAALEAGVHAGPLLVAGGEALLRDERLADAAEERIQDVGARVHARREAPNDLVHVVDVDVAVDGDREPHALAAGHRGDEEVSGPAVLPLVPLLQLDDAAAPVGHRERDVHVLHDARLQPLAQLVDRGLADGRVDVVAVEHVNAEREDGWLRCALAHRDGFHEEGRRTVRLGR